MLIKWISQNGGVAEGQRIDADPNPDLTPEIKAWRKNVKTSEKET